MCRQRAGCNDGTLTARKGQAATLEAWWKLPRRVFRGFRRLKAGKTAASNAVTREGYVQAKGCWNADGQELGGSCREGCGGFQGLY